MEPTVPIPKGLRAYSDAEIDAYVEDQFKDLPGGSYKIEVPGLFSMTTGIGGWIIFNKSLLKTKRDALPNRK